MSSWAWRRIRNGIDESIRLNPQDPEWTPVVVWRMMETLLGKESTDAVK